jgi:hypothetical protein
VISEPDFLPASITITPRLMPEMRRLRAGKFSDSGAAVSGSSDTIAPRPDSTIESKNVWFSGG